MNSFKIFTLFILLPFLSMAQPISKEVEKILLGRDYKQQFSSLDSLVFKNKNEDPSMALVYANKEIDVAIESDDEKMIGNAFSTRSKVYRQLAEFDKAELDLNKALEIYTKLNVKSWISSVNTDLGILAYSRGEFDKSITYYLKSLKISEAIKDQSAQASGLNNIGNIYFIQEKYDQAISFYQKAYEINKKLGDLKRTALTLDNIGLVYINKGEYDMALLYQTSALKTVEKLDDKQLLSESYMNLGALYQEMKKYDVALDYFEKAYDLTVKIDSKLSMTGCLVNIGESYKLQGKYDEAIAKTMQAYKISTEIGARSNVQQAASNLSDIYAEMKQFEKSLEYYKIYTATKDSIFNEESSNQINELAAKYEADKKEKEIELLTKDNDLNKTINISLYIGIGLVVILLSLLLYRYQEKRKANKLLEDKNLAINEQKELVDEKNKEITDSINYARKIQDAMLPSKKVLNEYFKDNFIFYQPKDIISGDFYWALRKEDKLYIAAADCTGHGVPGALMSMIGVTFLRQIVNEMNITDTAEILNRLHEMVLSTLNEDVSTRNSKDGMDVALLKIDLPNKTAQFSGAVRPLYVFSKSGFEVVKGDRFSIGGIKTMEETFTTTEIDLKGGKSFYLFSDGFADQFGQASGKKFMVKKLQNLLIDLNQYPMQEQEQKVSKIFNDWKGTLEQTDDVLLMGIKV